MIKKLFVGLLLTLAPMAGMAASRAAAPSGQNLVTMQNLVQEMLSAAEKKNWKRVDKCCRILQRSGCSLPGATDALYYHALALYHKGSELEALEAMDSYLNQQAPRYYMEAMELKLLVGESFAQGRKGPIFGIKGAPRIFQHRERGLQICEEVAAALPNHNLGARALMGQHHAHRSLCQFREAAEVIHRLIRKFPRDPIAQEAYVQLAAMFWDQSLTHFHDPNLLDAAELNLQKFRRAFPGSPRLKEVEALVEQLHERFAQGYLETAKFYKRINRPKSAAVYYAGILRQYPEAAVAEKARRSLQSISSRCALPEEIDELIRDGKPQS